MVQIKRIKLGPRRNAFSKCWQTIIKDKQSIPVPIKILSLLCFLCSMLIVGTGLGLWISQFSMTMIVQHDNAILASVVRNNNGISNGELRSTTSDTNTNSKTDEADAAADVTALIDAVPAALHNHHDHHDENDVDDKLKYDVEQELVKQIVHWMDYPFLQELKGSTSIDDDTTENGQNDEENNNGDDDYIIEHQDGDDHLFTKFIYKAKRSNLLLQEGIKLMEEYTILKAVDNNIESLLKEVGITYNLIQKIISKLKQVVTHAEENNENSKNGEHFEKGKNNGNGNKKFLGRHRVGIPPDDEDIRPLNDECNTKVSTITTIVFRGERHSGTKWIKSILEQNVKRSIYINQDDPKYGWKHGYLPPLGWGDRIPIDDKKPTVLLLVVTRDVFTWLPKMYAEAYDSPTNNYRIENKLTFSQFIRNEYGAVCHPTPGENREFYHQRKERQESFCTKLKYDYDVAANVVDPDPDGDDDTDDTDDTDEKKMKGVLLFDIETTITEHATNMIQIRTQKYKQWLSNELTDETFVGSGNNDNKKDVFNRNRVHINLESLYPPYNAKNANANADSNAYTDSNNNNNEAPTEEDVYRIQDHILGTPLDKHCIERMKDFQGISERTKFGKGGGHRGGGRLHGKSGGGFRGYKSKRNKRSKNKSYDRTDSNEDFEDNFSNKNAKRQKRRHHGRRLNQFDGKIYDATREAQQLIAMYTKEDLQFVLDQLDLDFERSIGYDYEYIKNMIVE